MHWCWIFWRVPSASQSRCCIRPAARRARALAGAPPFAAQMFKIRDAPRGPARAFCSSGRCHAATTPYQGIRDETNQSSSRRSRPLRQRPRCAPGRGREAGLGPRPLRRRSGAGRSASLVLSALAVCACAHRLDRCGSRTRHARGRGRLHRCGAGGRWREAAADVCRLQACGWHGVRVATAPTARARTRALRRRGGGCGGGRHASAAPRTRPRPFQSNTKSCRSW